MLDLRLERRDREAFDLRKLTAEQAKELLEALEKSRLEAEQPNPESDQYAHELEGWKP